MENVPWPTLRSGRGLKALPLHQKTCRFPLKQRLDADASIQIVASPQTGTGWYIVRGLEPPPNDSVHGSTDAMPPGCLGVSTLGNSAYLLKQWPVLPRLPTSRLGVMVVGG